MDCLVYVDPSQRGEWALELASLVLPRLARRVVLLATSEDAAKDRGLLARARARLPGIASLEAKTESGPAEKAIRAEVVAHRYHLVIVPPAGRNALQRMLKGSRVAAVVRSVPASVLVARRPPARLERILAALSGGAASRSVVEAAIEMEQASGAHATFLHVASEVALPYAPERGVAAPAPPEDAGARARGAGALRSRASGARGPSGRRSAGRGRAQRPRPSDRRGRGHQRAGRLGPRRRRRTLVAGVPHIDTGRPRPVDRLRILPADPNPGIPCACYGRRHAPPTTP